MAFLQRGPFDPAAQQIPDYATNNDDPGDSQPELGDPTAVPQHDPESLISPPQGGLIIETFQESVNGDEDATPEQVEAYDLDLTDLRRELRSYVKAPAKAAKARSTPTAIPEPPRPARALEGVADALVIFIHPEICAQCASIQRSHFIGIRRPLRRGGYAYIRFDPDSPMSAVASHLPILRRIQTETYVPICSQCCADSPMEQVDLTQRIEVNHASRSDSESDFEMFCQPARQLRTEETPDEPTND